MDKSDIIERVASVFHEKWRDARLYKSMIEKSEDKEWNMKHWTEVVDIANTKFEEYLQIENMKILKQRK